LSEHVFRHLNVIIQLLACFDQYLSFILQRGLEIVPYQLLDWTAIAQFHTPLTNIELRPLGAIRTLQPKEAGTQVSDSVLHGVDFILQLFGQLVTAHHLAPNS